jgi:hypothetical protein
MTTPEIMSSLKNPRWAAAPPSEDIILDAKFNGNPITFRASANDVVKTGRDIHKAAIDGKYGVIEGYVAPPPQQNQPIKGVPTMASPTIDLIKRIEALEKDVAELKAKR